MRTLEISEPSDKNLCYVSSFTTKSQQLLLSDLFMDYTTCCTYEADFSCDLSIFYEESLMKS